MRFLGGGSGNGLNMRAEASEVPDTILPYIYIYVCTYILRHIYVHDIYIYMYIHFILQY